MPKKNKPKGRKVKADLTQYVTLQKVLSALRDISARRDGGAVSSRRIAIELQDRNPALEGVKIATIRKDVVKQLRIGSDQNQCYLVRGRYKIVRGSESSQDDSSEEPTFTVGEDSGSDRSSYKANRKQNDEADDPYESRDRNDEKNDDDSSVRYDSKKRRGKARGRNESKCRRSSSHDRDGDDESDDDDKNDFDKGKKRPGRKSNARSRSGSNRSSGRGGRGRGSRKSRKRNNRRGNRRERGRSGTKGASRSSAASSNGDPDGNSVLGLSRKQILQLLSDSYIHEAIGRRRGVLRTTRVAGLRYLNKEVEKTRSKRGTAKKTAARRNNGYESPGNPGPRSKRRGKRAAARRASVTSRKGVTTRKARGGGGRGRRNQYRAVST